MELSGPIAIRVRGRDRDRLRVVSGLLHGNEPSGLRAIYEALRRRLVPATDVLFFVGAVEAARHERLLAHRMIPGRRDLNRCFRPPFEGKDGQMAEEALSCMRSRDLEAVVDLHNNTGHNPAYGVGLSARGRRLGVTRHFARRFVASEIELGALHQAFSPRIPAVVIECGRAGDPVADALATSGLAGFLAEDRLASVRPSEFQILTAPVRVVLRRDLDLRFDDVPNDADLTMALDVDRHNFQELPPGARIGWIRRGAALPIVATTESWEDVTAQLFEVHGTELLTRVPVIPIMMTTNPTVAVSDCLFYAVQRRRRRRTRLRGS
jgi:hypothetical protein